MNQNARRKSPNYDSQFGGWRYRMIAVLNGIDTEIYNIHSNIARLPPLHPPRPAEMRPITGKHYMDGRDFKMHDIKIEFMPEPNRKCVIEHDFDVDSKAFSQVRLEFEYFENVNDQSSLARIDLTSDYETKDKA